MDDELREIEEKLEQLAPAAMPDDMVARMAQAMDNWQVSLPVEEKIVPFQSAVKGAGKLHSFNVWATAAAVTLIAAASFTLFSGEQSSENTLAAASKSVAPIATTTIPSQNIGKAVQASHAQFQTQVTNASNEMIAYDALGRPMRVMQLHFEDEVTVRDANGKPHKVKQPRVEYYATPVEIH